MGILNKKLSNQKEEVRTVNAKGCYETILYAGYVECPHCGVSQHVECEGKPPKVRECVSQSCGKRFNIEWE